MRVYGLLQGLGFRVQSLGFAVCFLFRKVYWCLHLGYDDRHNCFSFCFFFFFSLLYLLPLLPLPSPHRLPAVPSCYQAFRSSSVQPQTRLFAVYGIAGRDMSGPNTTFLPHGQSIHASTQSPRKASSKTLIHTSTFPKANKPYGTGGHACRTLLLAACSVLVLSLLQLSCGETTLNPKP